MSNKKRQSISLETKYKIIVDLGNNVRVEEIMKKYGLKNVTNVYRIRENKEKFINAYIENKSTNQRKKLREGKFKEVENEVKTQFESAREVNIPISGKELQEMAKNAAIEKGITSFKGSNGWLQKFKNRESLKTSVISGESNSVNPIIADDWVNKKLPQIIKDYRPQDLFNGDEFGLFYCINNLRIRINLCIAREGKYFANFM